MTRDNAIERDASAVPAPVTLAAVLFPVHGVAAQRELERYRVAYEAVHGPTDLTLRYTSMLPLEQQTWLYNNHPGAYWKGLPPFARAFLRDRSAAAAAAGNLDALPDTYLRLYCSGQMSF